MKTNYLIADSKETDWDMVSETLVGEGNSVYFAGTTGETEELLTIRRFFLVFLELELPRGGGEALVRRIKRSILIWPWLSFPHKYLLRSLSKMWMPEQKIIGLSP